MLRALLWIIGIGVLLVFLAVGGFFSLLILNERQLNYEKELSARYRRAFPTAVGVGANPRLGPLDEDFFLPPRASMEFRWGPAGPANKSNSEIRSIAQGECSALSRTVAVGCQLKNIRRNRAPSLKSRQFSIRLALSTRDTGSYEASKPWPFIVLMVNYEDTRPGKTDRGRFLIYENLAQSCAKFSPKVKGCDIRNLGAMTQFGLNSDGKDISKTGVFATIVLPKDVFPPGL